jgi:hypothetical protein
MAERGMAPVPRVAPMEAAPARRTEDRGLAAAVAAAADISLPEATAAPEDAPPVPSAGAEVRPLIRPRRVVLSGEGRSARPRPGAEAGSSLI